MWFRVGSRVSRIRVSSPTVFCGCMVGTGYANLSPASTCLVVVSRFFCFAILLNFAEIQKWLGSPAWRASDSNIVGVHMRGSNPARPGPIASCRVGKSKKVVKRRGVGALVFAGENYQGVLGSREDLDGSGPGMGLGLDSGVV